MDGFKGVKTYIALGIHLECGPVPGDPSKALA